MKVYIYSAHPYETPFLQKAAGEKHELNFTSKKLSVDTAVLASGNDALAIFTADDASAPVLDLLRAQGIRYIALRSAGFDHVDLAAAKKHGIHVANVPAYSPYSIAEHAAALLLALNRRLIEGRRLIDSRDFRLDPLIGFDIHGKTVGIIGTGTIGRAFVNIMLGFGAKVIAFDPIQNETVKAMGVTYVSQDELFERSDIISIHCPLNEKTKQLISRRQLEKMKKGAIIINTSRGGVINTSDLLNALDSGRLGGACLDVYEKEKSLFFEDHRSSNIADPLFDRLASHKNVIVTGHQAFLTIEALTGIAETTIENLDRWANGDQSPNEL
ncbi:MAG: 2-hydroxyacid dehydrogenase [Chryseolinea sp.]